MKPVYKFLIGAGAVTGAVLLFSSFKSAPKVTTNPNSTNPNSTDAKATVSQFDKLVDLATSKKSDWFQGLSTADLIHLRSAFMSNLTGKEADTLTTLLGQDESSWKASDKINFDYLMKKWRSTVPKQITTPAVSTAPKPTTTASNTGKYDPTKDAQYDEKVDILSKWYDYVVATNKKRTIPRYVPSKNNFEARFLPWTVNDLNAYTGLVYMGEKNRGVRENDIMANLKQKYPASFKGSDTIYSFTGSPVMLSNKTNWNF